MDKINMRAAQIVSLLCERGLSVVTAESCTGGLVAATLSAMKNAGTCVHGGFVVYSAEQKTCALAIDAALIARNGAVDAEVTAQLAKAALARSPADIAVALTGVAGPKRDEHGSPVGRLYIGAATRGGDMLDVAHQFDGLDPAAFREAAVVAALDLIERAAIADSRWNSRVRGALN